MALTRFAIVHRDTGFVETGANYPGCTKDTPAACDPQTFGVTGSPQGSLDAAKYYADQHGELLYVLGYATAGTPQWDQLVSQVWMYVANPALIPPQLTRPNMATDSISLPVLIGGGLLLWAFL